MTIQIDTREKQKAIQAILRAFDNEGAEHISSKLYVGDYMNFDNPRVIVDRKQNLNELCSNVCRQHKRFIAEIERANAAGIRLVFLCEHGKGVRTLSDVNSWYNPRLKKSPNAVSGQRLFKILYTIHKKYGVEFEFCTKEETGHKILELLSQKPKNGAVDKG